MTEKSRLFLAVNFSPATRKKLGDLVSLLAGASDRGRFCQPDQLHLTLAFLGECDLAQLELIKTIMAATRAGPFELTITRIDRFPGRNGDIWWAGLAENKRLQQLQEDLALSLHEASFQLDRRPYKPHITLGRAVETRLPPQNVPCFSQPVSQIDLMKSSRDGQKMLYSCIYSVGLV